MIKKKGRIGVTLSLDIFTEYPIYEKAKEKGVASLLYKKALYEWAGEDLDINTMKKKLQDIQEEAFDLEKQKEYLISQIKQKETEEAEKVQEKQDKHQKSNENKEKARENRNFFAKEWIGRDLTDEEQEQLNSLIADAEEIGQKWNLWDYITTLPTKTHRLERDPEELLIKGDDEQ